MDSNQQLDRFFKFFNLLILSGIRSHQKPQKQGIGENRYKKFPCHRTRSLKSANVATNPSPTITEAP